MLIDPSLLIRLALPTDIRSINSFYSRQDSSAQVDNDEAVMIAELDGAIIGSVRLCVEHGHTLLRTMLIDRDHRRKGIGAKMLELFDRTLGDRECFCLPYSHLVSFYGAIGFEPIDEALAPEHLRERYHSYLARGLDVLIMRRSTHVS